MYYVDNRYDIRCSPPAHPIAVAGCPGLAGPGLLGLLAAPGLSLRSLALGRDVFPQEVDPPILLRDVLLQFLVLLQQLLQLGLLLLLLLLIFILPLPGIVARVLDDEDNLTQDTEIERNFIILNKVCCRWNRLARLNTFGTKTSAMDR